MHIPYPNVKHIHEGHVGESWFYKTHYHHEYEILLCLEGSATEWIGGNPYEFSRDDVLLISPHVRHSTLNSSKQAFGYFSFLFDYMEGALKELFAGFPFLLVKADGNQPYPIQDEAAALMDAYRKWRAEPDALNKLTLSSRLLGLLTALANYLQIELERDGAEQIELLKPYAIELAHQFMALLDKEMQLSIEEASRRLSLSRSHATRLFTRAFGISPKVYQRTRIVEQAQALLVSTSMTVNQISDELGFTSVQHFCRQYKRWTGSTPGQHRNVYASSYSSSIEEHS